MKTLQLVLGNQLFPAKYFDKKNPVFMCEAPKLCNRFKYHKHKIIFFLSAMRNFKEELTDKGFEVTYIKIDKEALFLEELSKYIQKHNIEKLKCYEVEDHFFDVSLKKLCKQSKVELEISNSPMFLNTKTDFEEYLSTGKTPFMKTFYEAWRKRSGVLMEKGKPTGGKYSFDAENRKKIPKKFDVPNVTFSCPSDQHTEDVISEVDRLFKNHPGKTDNFWLAVTRKEAKKRLKEFFNNRAELFGDYEDALDERNDFLFHSVLSPYLNIGLLLPQDIIDESIKSSAPLNSKEGLIRQVAGWREFMRGIYHNYGDKQLKSNFFDFNRKLTKDWYKGTTGILPLDDAIKKADRIGYCHHIERLMVLSNMMLLAEISPKEVYKWFMEMFVDSSDWVMVPNVMGMGQFSDGGIFATKPYICGSNYIIKMSHYKKDEWCETMDGLYWRFIGKNRKFFEKNYRMAMMVKLYDKMDDEKKSRITKKAEDFLDKFTK